MKPELDAKLRSDYPLIFTVEPTVDPDDSDVPPVPSPFAMRGFECGDGWYDLIDVLCLNLQHATKNGAPQIVASQVKEKFGGLRFYANGPDGEQAAMIGLAETMSKRLCEVCGNRGKVIRNGWIQTRCPQHEND
ncbi:hypothetical protein M3A49_00970 [Paraburkholderia sp. CNPSo 3076]|uniref:hypothetical protein n=1 Tax=Paraburkholderia sp. CNPSo 3076 TaxID=2940936 RepID=UPI002257A3D0|nr:hypothetical protein [Paraburkholderia sp. CNPSo 3076]MCX5538083.1 hypothetical protein [Paraburkholderia sp. CNPSo 3076]